MGFKISRVIYLLVLSLCLLDSSDGQGVLKLVKHYADQEKACEEFEKCMTKLAQSTKGVPSTIKKVELGPDLEDIPVHHFLCARRSNCRHQQRAFCEPHMGPHGTIEMKFLCQITWVSGSDETDKSDPETSFGIEEDQNVACSNYEKCMETPNEAFAALRNLPHIPILGHYVPKIAKQSLCAIRMNCLQEMKKLCDEGRLASEGYKIEKIATLFCSFVPYAEVEARNSAGSRSLGGSLSQHVLSDVCKSPKDGVCSLV